MADVEGLRDDPGRATGWATQLQTPAQDCLDLFKVYFQGLNRFSRKGAKIAKAQRHARAFDPPLRLCDLCAFA